MRGDGLKDLESAAQKETARKQNAAGQAKLHHRHSTAVGCQVEGCTRRLAREKEYYQRYRVCKYHSSQSVVLLDGVPHRFCQQCCCFEQMSSFDGDRRSCRARLLLHNSRRKQRIDSRSCNLSDVDEDAAHPTPAAATANSGSSKRSSGSTPRTPHTGMATPFANSPPVDQPVDALAEAFDPLVAPPTARRTRTNSGHKRSSSGDVDASSDQGEDARMRSGAAAHASATSSCPSAQGAGSMELPDKYDAVRSQSAHFSVSGVAEMWAKDDEVNGGDVLAGLDCDLDFASLSVSLDEVPANGNTSAEAIQLADAPSHSLALPVRSKTPAGGAAPVLQQQPITSIYPEPHPIAAALKGRWATCAPQEAAAAQPSGPQFGSPTAQLLKRHWSDTTPAPKSHFARVSWGSGSDGPPKPKRMQVDSGDLSSTAVVTMSSEPPGPALATLQQVEAALLAAGAISSPLAPLASPPGKSPLSAVAVRLDGAGPFSETGTLPSWQLPVSLSSPPQQPQFEDDTNAGMPPPFVYGAQQPGASNHSSGAHRSGSGASVSSGSLLKVHTGGGGSGQGSPSSAFDTGRAAGIAAAAGMQQQGAGHHGSGSFPPLGLGNQWADSPAGASTPQQQQLASMQLQQSVLAQQQQRASTRTHSQPTYLAARQMMMQMGTHAQQAWGRQGDDAALSAGMHFSSTRQASLPAASPYPFDQPGFMQQRLPAGQPLGHGLVQPPTQRLNSLPRAAAVAAMDPVTAAYHGYLEPPAASAAIPGRPTVTTACNVRSPGRGGLLEPRGFAMPEEPVHNTVVISGSRAPPIDSPFSLPANQPAAMQQRHTSLGASLQSAASDVANFGSGGISNFIFSQISAEAMQEAGGWGITQDTALIGTLGHAEPSAAGFQQHQQLQPQQQPSFTNPYSTWQRAQQSSAAGAAAATAYVPPPIDNLTPLWATRAKVPKARATQSSAQLMTSGDGSSPPRGQAVDAAGVQSSTMADRLLSPRQSSLCTSTAQQLSLGESPWQQSFGQH